MSILDKILSTKINFKTGFIIFLIIPIVVGILSLGNILLYPIFYIVKFGFINKKYYNITYIFSLITTVLLLIKYSV
jgi:hypothetical protein